MLIYVITSLYPTESNPVAGSFIYEQCKALSLKGNKVVVLNVSSVGWKNWNIKNTKKPILKEEGNLISLSLPYNGFAISRTPNISTKKCYKNLEKLYLLAYHTYGKPDIVHAHFSFPAGYAASMLKRKYKFPLVITEHYSLYLNDVLNKDIIKQLAVTLEESDEFICVSDYLRKAIYKWTNSKKQIQVIPNMIDEMFVYNKVPKNTEEFIFFSAGALRKIKRFDLLINSFCKAFKSTENVYLQIAGGGKQFRQLDSLIKKNQREHQIKLLGVLSRNEIVKANVNSHCFVLASKHETFGVVYREAMAIGRPVISTNNGGIYEGWEDKFGLIVKVDDMDQLAIALQAMYNNYNSYDYEYISQKCLNKYSTTKVVDKILEVYTKVLSIK